MAKTREELLEEEEEVKFVERLIGLIEDMKFISFLDVTFFHFLNYPTSNQWI